MECRRCVFLPSLSCSGIPRKPHAGPNEQCAGEGIFFNPAQGLIEQPHSTSTDAKCSCQQLHIGLILHNSSIFCCFLFSSSSVSALPLFSTVLSIRPDSTSTASYYEMCSNNLKGLAGGYGSLKQIHST